MLPWAPLITALVTAGKVVALGGISGAAGFDVKKKKPKLVRVNPEDEK